MPSTDRAFDQILSLIEQDRIPLALPLLCGTLYSLRADEGRWPGTVDLYQRHPLRQLMNRDPFIRRCVEKPRGYAGDATLIDYLYDREVPVETDSLGTAMFNHTTAFPISDAVRGRRDYAAQRLHQATMAGQRVLVLACGHMREATTLSDEQLKLVTAIDQDAESLAEVRLHCGDSAEVVEANAVHFLRSAAKAGRQWDFIYTLGLTDYFDDRTMTLFHKLLHACVAHDGSILLANFVHDHLAVGWLEAVMDWHLIYRTEAQLAGFAAQAGLTPQTWTDPAGTIAYCEMQMP